MISKIQHKSTCGCGSYPCTARRKLFEFGTGVTMLVQRLHDGGDVNVSKARAVQVGTKVRDWAT